jgi:HSP20 family protein
MSKASETVPAKQPVATPAETNPWHSLIDLRRDMDRMFEDLSTRFLGSRFLPRDMTLEPFTWLGDANGKLSPAVDVVEQDKEYQVTAEIPGMDEKDVEVTVSGGLLTIKGEKHADTEERKKDYFMAERRYGSFHRALRLPDGIDADKVAAKFAKGVLTVTLPKKPDSIAKEKKIPIATE